MRFVACLLLALVSTGCQTFYPGTTLSVDSPTGKSIRWQNGKDFGFAAESALMETSDGTKIELKNAVIGNNASDVADAWSRVDRARFDGVVGIIDATGRFAGVVMPMMVQPPTAPPASQPALPFPFPAQ